MKVPKHIFIAASAWVSRLVIAILQLASLRVLANTLNLDEFAVYMLMIGLAPWFLLADIGMGVSLKNYISEYRAKRKSYNDLITIVGVLAFTFLIIETILLYFLSPYVSSLLLNQFVTLTDDQKTELFFTSSFIFISTGIGGIVFKIWYAEQKGYLSNIVPAIATSIGFISLWTVSEILPDPHIHLCLIAFLMPTALIPILALIINNYRKWSGVTVYKLINITALIFGRGAKFWAFGIIAASIINIDYIVISQFLNSNDIALYFITTKVFSLLFFVYSAVLLALWPVITELITKGKWVNVINYLKRYIAFGLIFMSVSTLSLMWLMPIAVDLMAPGKGLIVPVKYILLLGGYQLILIWTNTFAMILQSMSDLKPFWIPTIAQALIGFSLQWTLAPIYGVYGVTIALVGSFLLTVSWALPLAVRQHYKNHIQNYL